MIAYMDYLENTYGFKLTIKDFAGFMTQDVDTFKALNRFYRHQLPFCDNMKKTPKLYDSCYNNTLRLERYLRAKKREPYIASCYCGIYDLIYPVYYKDTLIAAVCLYGFNYNYDKTIEKFNRVLGNSVRRDRWLELLDQSIGIFDAKTADWESIKIQIGVIAEHICMTYLLLVEKEIIVENAVYARKESHLWTFSKVLDYIQQHYTEQITLDQVCEYSQVSKSYVSHAFRQFSGTNFKHYLNRLRITKAQELLKKDLTIKDVALTCGYIDPNYFSVVFKQFTKMTPSEYKKNNLL